MLSIVFVGAVISGAHPLPVLLFVYVRRVLLALHQLYSGHECLFLPLLVV